MTLSKYLDYRKWVLSKPYRLPLLKFFYKLLPAFIYVLYPLTLLHLLLQRDWLLLQTFFVPLAGFLSVTWLRRFIGAQRPYEKYGLPPLIEKTTRRKSFPSRHCASAAVIAVTLWPIHWLMGFTCAVIGVLIAICRVLAGVHFPRDVVGGLLYGAFFGWIGLGIFSIFL